MKTLSRESFMKGVFALCAALSIAAVVLILIFLAVNGVPAIEKLSLIHI